VIAAALDRGEGWLEQRDVNVLLDCYGIARVPSHTVATPDDAEDAARRIGTPVALKAIGPGLVHKSDVGGVALDVSPTGTAARAREMLSALQTNDVEPSGFVVQPMVPDGVETLIGVTHDPIFGPVLAVAAGGTAAELMRDVAVRITPITDLDAHDMLRELSIFPLLDGYRGAPPADVTAIERTLLRVSAMVEDHASITELDLNPVIALRDQAVVVDARIKIELTDPRRMGEGR
jgi:acyl-CoA synthetase (NDP forming)